MEYKHNISHFIKICLGTTWVNTRDSHGQSVAPPIPRQELCTGLHVPCGHVEDQAVTGKGVDVFLPDVSGAVDVT